MNEQLLRNKHYVSEVKSKPPYALGGEVPSLVPPRRSRANTRDVMQRQTLGRELRQALPGR